MLAWKHTRAGKSALLIQGARRVGNSTITNNPFKETVLGLQKGDDISAASFLLL